MTAVGHSLLSRAISRPGHVRCGPKAEAKTAYGRGQKRPRFPELETGACLFIRASDKNPNFETPEVIAY
jgi:hypothetical protein